MRSRERVPASDGIDGVGDLYSVARASAIRVLLVASIQYTIGAAVAAAVTYWITGKPIVLAVALVIGLLSAIMPALPTTNSTIA